MVHHIVIYIGHMITTSRISPYYEYHHGKLIEFRISSMKDIMERNEEIHVRQATEGEYQTIMTGIEQDE